MFCRAHARARRRLMIYLVRRSWVIGTIHERNWVAKQVMGDFNLPVGYPDLPRVSLTGPSDVVPNNGATHGWVLGVCLVFCCRRHKCWE